MEVELLGSFVPFPNATAERRSPIAGWNRLATFVEALGRTPHEVVSLRIGLG